MAFTRGRLLFGSLESSKGLLGGRKEINGDSIATYKQSTQVTLQKLIDIFQIVIMRR